MSAKVSAARFTAISSPLDTRWPPLQPAAGGGDDDAQGVDDDDEEEDDDEDEDVGGRDVVDDCFEMKEYDEWNIGNRKDLEQYSPAPLVNGYANCNHVDGDDCFVRSSWIIAALQPSTDMSKSKAVLEIVMMVVLVLWRKSRINMI